MKKISVLLALSALAGAASAQSVIYNTVASSYTYYTGTGNQLAGDNVFLPTLTGGQSYDITSFSFVAFATAAGTYSVPITVNFYDTVNSSGTAFTNLVKSVSTGISNFTASGAGSGSLFTLSNLDIPLAATQGTLGYGVSFQFGTTTSSTGGTGALTIGYTSAGSSVAGSGYSTGEFIDTSNDGILQSNEFYTLGSTTVYKNIAMSLTANAVPEPSTVAALGLGAVAVLRRRKKA